MKSDSIRILRRTSRAIPRPAPKLPRLLV